MSKRVPKGWVVPNPEKYIVQMENLSSEEVYLSPEGGQVAVLHSNSLDVCRGESWGILGREAFELELLLQIMGCVRPYASGRCRLVERGMMRKKRKILPHVFFVGDSGMAVPNMNVLEYLMFATQYTSISARERQIAFLTSMLTSDCYEWCMAPVKALSTQERAVLSLLAASFSNALLIIFPYFFQDTPPALRRMIAYVAKALEQKGAALVLGACDPNLVQATCTRCAFLIHGSIQQKGTVEELQHKWDKRDFVIRASDQTALQSALRERLPDCDIRLRDRYVDIYHGSSGALLQDQFLALIADLDIPMDSIRKSKKTLQNAFSEAHNDLSDELL
ncbi:MAG: hypothetical protein RR521_02660 [Clostridia bacterium]